MVSKRTAAIVTALITLGLVGGAYFFASVLASRQQDQARVLAGQVAKLQRAVLASCGAASDIGSAPLSSPGSRPPSKLAIQFVADERAQWHKLGCPGRLPVQPGLLHWATVYHIPVK